MKERTIECNIELPIAIKIVAKLLSSSTYTVTQKEFSKYDYSPSTIHGAFESLVKKGILLKTEMKSGQSWIYTGTISRDDLVDLLEA